MVCAIAITFAFHFLITQCVVHTPVQCIHISEHLVISSFITLHVIDFIHRIPHFVLIFGAQPSLSCLTCTLPTLCYSLSAGPMLRGLAFTHTCRALLLLWGPFVVIRGQELEAWTCFDEFGLHDASSSAEEEKATGRVTLQGPTHMIGHDYYSAWRFKLGLEADPDILYSYVVLHSNTSQTGAAPPHHLFRSCSASA